jgi:hypothetical protein
VVVDVANFCASRTLAPGESCTVMVRFKPKTSGPKSAKLRIPSNDPDETVVKVSLGGAAVAPDIVVTPTSLPFGPVVVGIKKIQIVTVKNDGTADLVLGPTRLNTATSEVSVAAGRDLCSRVTLAPGQSCTFAVKIMATAPGPKTATISIPSNDPDENIVHVTVAATAS